MTHGRAEVLATLAELTAGQQRPEVRAAFEDGLRVDPETTIPTLATLSDPGMLPAMMRTLEQLDETDPLLRHPIVELVEAIETLGGNAGELGVRKVETVRAARARWLATRARPPQRRKKRSRR